MDKQQIIKHLDDFCSDITVKGNTIYLDRLLTVGITVADETMTVFWETPTGRSRKQVYTDINSMDDIVDVWSEFMHHWNKTADRLRKALVQGSI
jgi:hypothetical protein